MKEIFVDWTTLKSFVDAKNLSIQYVQTTNMYYLRAVDNHFCLAHDMDRNPAITTDLNDFDNNYKSNGNKSLDERDSDGAVLAHTKICPTGWGYRAYYIEIVTSTLNSLYDKDADGDNYGFSTIKFYNSSDTELTTQNDLDSSCVKTVVDFEPTFDYEILGGKLRKYTDIGSNDCRIWVIAVPDLTVEQGGSKVFVDGINLKYLAGSADTNEDARAPKRLSYNATYHTNKLRFIIKHSTALKADIQICMEMYTA